MRAIMLINFLDAIYLYVRPLIKWFLHKFTKLCELQRLCYGCQAGCERVRKVERSLELSRCQQIKLLLINLNNTVEHGVDEAQWRTEITNRALNTVLLVKKINPRVHSTFSKPFATCVDMIWSYRRLQFHIEDLRTQPYDEEEPEHEQKLIELWNLLMPDTPLEARVTKQWQDIGFQGDDPKTDFRGMGVLGLENLLYFARNYPGSARHLLSHSQHPKHGYTFAVVGINITHMAWRLLKSGKAKSHFYNCNTQLTLDHFHQFYCFLFFEFDQHWVAAMPQSIMEFSTVQQSFEHDVLKLLKRDKCHFKMNLCVENV